jgi:putative ABC transport system substrate-binding protein
MRRREFMAGIGSAATWPIVARAQQPKVPVIGFLSWDFPSPNVYYTAAFRQGLTAAGYIEGQNVAIEYRWANGQRVALRPLAEELVHRPVDLIVAIASTAVAHSAKAATSTVPIVFVYGADPVKDGLVASLNRPGGNITGVVNFNTNLGNKRLGLLFDAVPHAAIFAFLSGSPNSMTSEASDVLEAGHRLGRKIVILEVTLEAGSDPDYEAAFRTLVHEQAGGLIVGAFTFQNTNKILALAARNKVPAIYPGRGFVRAGGLMSYGPVSFDLYRQAGIYAARILKGEKPADLPVIQPTKFELVINLKTAKALGLTVPETLLATAEELIQ